MAVPLNTQIDFKSDMVEIKQENSIACFDLRKEGCHHFFNMFY